MFFNFFNNRIKKYRDLRSKDIDYETAKVILRNNEAVLLDVRSRQEYNEYNLLGSINVPLYELKMSIKDIIKDNNKTIIVYCQSGARSRKAIEILTKLGYKNLYNIKGGIDNI